MASLFCTTCGAPMTEADRFCRKCGTPAPSAGVVQPAPAAITPQPAYVAATRYGSFWLRFIAVVIDAFIVEAVVVTARILFFGGGMIGMRHMGWGFPVVGGFGFGFGIIGGWLYEAFLMSSSYEATLGKMLFHLRVTDANGTRISFAQATLRHFAKYLSGLILFIGYIMAAFTERRQALHDLIANTIVVSD